MNKAKRLFVLMSLDAAVVSSSIVLAFYLQYGSEWKEQFMPHGMLFGGLTVIFSLASLYIGKLYHRVWQYASVGELYSIVKALCTSVLIAFCVTWLCLGGNMSVGIILSLLETMLLGIGGIRFIRRLIQVRTGREHSNMKSERTRTLVVGAGSCGSLITREMLKQKSTFLEPMEPICIVDDDISKLHCEIHGVLVAGMLRDIPQLVEEYNVEVIVIAIPSLSMSQLKPIVDICIATKARVRMIPLLNDLIQGKVTINKISDVDIEVLLGREQIRLDMGHISTYLHEKTVLVTGAGGSIGSELCRQIAHFEPNALLLLGQGENSIYVIERELRSKYPKLKLETVIADVKDAARIDRIFATYEPQVVFHAAAHKHVPLMERNPSEAVKNNLFGTIHVALAAHRYGADRFVFISSDKAVNPTSVMGATKRAAEMYIQSLSKQSSTVFAAVRFGNVLGSRGSVIPLFKEQIQHGGPVTVTHPDMIRYFMTIPEAVQLVMQAGAYAEGGEVFVLDMGEPVKIVDLARAVIRLSGYEPDVDIPIVFTGIRPGEKLFEEMLTAEEGLNVTKHSRIFVGRPPIVPQQVLEEEVVAIKEILNEENPPIREALKRLIPTYMLPNEDGFTNQVAATVCTDQDEKQAVVDWREKKLSLV
ncbi:polysaccharide biosynthesis protein [Paenibacillus assamensis]|uniref:polysaccharide biosynthesis protein n=1 Tax=Paenibacillus assamensis TaxID=311244 RepID=UPI0004037EA3|nr:nucleoside-diphosphate sugar epimerase/dehydratase [Paenibacillus assamensis]